MQPNNITHLAAAAHRRHELTRAKAIHALRELDHAGAAITFDAVARHAGISRSWLYTQPDLRTEVERLREATRRAPTPSIPSAQRASDQSLLRRLHAANEHNRRLTEENQRLRRQLAHALGDQRAAAATESSKHRKHRASVTIGPPLNRPLHPDTAVSQTSSSTRPPSSHT
jgi:hypothetical protein